jgi:hypothetical protein
MRKSNYPKGLRLRVGRDGKSNYYLKLANGAGEKRLHGDLACVLLQWRKYQIDSALREANIRHLSGLLKLYAECEIPVRIAIEGKQCAYLFAQVDALITFFRESGDPGLFDDLPDPNKYLKWRDRSCAYRANCEMALVNHIFRWTKLHTPIPIRASSWARSSSSAELHAETLRELGTAMVFYHDQTCLHGCRDKVAHSFTSPARTAHHSGEDVRSRDQTKLQLDELRLHSVRQLKLDGRPDLAETLTRLSQNDLQRALSLAEQAMITGTSPQLVLGTRRIERLKALQSAVDGRSKRAR